MKDRSLEVRVLKAALASIVFQGVLTTAAQAFDWSSFFDTEDGFFDVSDLLSRGGFLPVPVIITEPAVEGGLGIAGQFISPSATPGAAPGRTILGSRPLGRDR